MPIHQYVLNTPPAPPQEIQLQGDVTGVGVDTIPTTIEAQSVGWACLENMDNTNVVLGRQDQGSGPVQEMVVGGGLELTNDPGIQRSALTGDVTASAGSNDTSISAKAVTYSKVQDIANTDRVLGRASPGAGVIEEIVCTGAARDFLTAVSPAAQRAAIGAATIYQNQVIKTAKIWSGTALTSGGIATFYPTDNNLVSGNALFVNFFSVHATAERNTSSAIAVPKASLKSISMDKKTVTINVVNGLLLSLLGLNSEVFAPDGIAVHLTIIGD